MKHDDHRPFHRMYVYMLDNLNRMKDSNVCDLSKKKDLRTEIFDNWLYD